MKRLASWRGFFGILLVFLVMLPAGCMPVPDCSALRRSLTGTWISTDEYPGGVWSFPATFTLDADQTYRSGDLVGLWDLGYAPENTFCDILFVGDSGGTIHTTYGLQMDGDYLVLDIWGRSVTYYKEGTPPPPSAD